MANLNPYKLQVGKRIYSINPAPDRKANWAVCRQNGTRIGIYCGTKKEVRQYLAKKHSCKKSEIKELD